MSTKIGKIYLYDYIDMMKYCYILSVIIAMSCSFGVAQNPSFIASVDKNRVATGEQFEITFSLNGNGGGDNFHSPAFTDFLTVSGPNQSTNMQFINGSVSSSVSYSYVLQPKAEGKFTIGPATIEVGGKQLKTQPVNIEVTKGSPQQAQQNGGQGNNGDISKQIGDNLFLKVTVDKSACVSGRTDYRNVQNLYSNQCC